MRECAYELYVSIYTAVREGILLGDARITARVSTYIARRTGVDALVGTLAIIEASHGEPPRAMKDVCNGVLCNRKCRS